MTSEQHCRRWPLWLARVGSVVAIWLAIGFLRAPAVAREPGQ